MLVGCAGNLGNIPLIIRHEYKNSDRSFVDDKIRAIAFILPIKAFPIDLGQSIIDPDNK